MAMLILTEGRVTEPRYFREYLRVRGISGVDVRPARSPDPLNMVSEAIAARNADPSARIWLVMDAEDRAEAVRRRRLHKALAQVEKAGLACAVSWPCFELWLLLHEEEPGGLPLDTAAIAARLRKRWQTPRIKQDFPVQKLVAPGRVEAARRRAAALRASTPGSPPANYAGNRTDVDSLVAVLGEWPRAVGNAFEDRP